MKSRLGDLKDVDSKLRESIQQTQEVAKFRFAWSDNKAVAHLKKSRFFFHFPFFPSFISRCWHTDRHAKLQKHPSTRHLALYYLLRIALTNSNPSCVSNNWTVSTRQLTERIKKFLQWRSLLPETALLSRRRRCRVHLQSCRGPA